MGILAEHALEFARLTEKRLGTSKFSSSIFEHFRWVIELLGRLGRYEDVRRLKNIKMQLLRNLVHSNGLEFPRKFLIISPHPNFEVNKLSLEIRYVFQGAVLTIFRFEALD